MRITDWHAYLTPRNVVIGAVVLSLCAVGLTFALVRKPSGGTYVSPQKGAITAIVVNPGEVKAAEEIDLSFQTGGRISWVGAPVGSTVYAGQLLASLNASDQQAALEAAQASLAIQQANLQSLKDGARPEDIAVSESAVTAAQTSLSNAEQGVIVASRSGFNAADSAINAQVAGLFNNPTAANPTFALQLSDSATKTEIENEYPQVEAALSQWHTQLSTLPTTVAEGDISTLSSTSQAALTQVGSFLDLVASGLVGAVPNATYSSATIASQQAAVAAARSNVAAALSAVTTATNAEASASSALATAKSQLSLKQAGPTADALAAQEAQVQAAQAQVDAAKATVSKTGMYAPISGVITVNNAHVGATATQNSPLISMQSNARYQIETYVSDADVSKISLGNSALVSLDSYPNDTPLSAKVIAIDPAATMQSGTPSYKVTLQFDANDPRLKAGMTGAVTITTASSSQAMIVPASAIITQNGQQFVLKKTPSGDVLTSVVVGIHGATTTEIRSGLSVGDSIRTFGSQ